MSKTAKIVLDSNEHDLPVVTGSENENAIDISKLRASTGYITIDPGYKNTGATKSAITFLDGEKGILRYRGYPIEQLAANASFMEVAYLLIYGELPNAIELQLFERSIKRHPRTYLIDANTIKTEEGLVNVTTGMQNMEYVEILSGITKDTYIYKPN
jgi:citrate synthase